MDIDRLRNIADSIWNEYVGTVNDKQSWLRDYNIEIQSYKEYRGREIYELLQNADDAKSDFVEIILDTNNHLLTITNSGKNTILFDEEGFRSIMISNLSPKKGKRMIGAKGLGFRSVLNWSDRIEIKSGNVKVVFSVDNAVEKWKILRDKVDDAERYLALARKDGRSVPLAILALPCISLCSEPISQSTTIVLSYEKEREASIVADLENFSPESLLFLHHINRVSLVIDGKKREYYRKNIDVSAHFAKCELNGSKWVIASKKGTFSGGDLDFEVSCAFCLDMPQDTYPIFSFFPTRVKFPFPCILHATLELDSSRNAILPDDNSNKDVMRELALQMQSMADYLKEQRCDWYPYRLMNPDPQSVDYNEYVKILVSQLKELSSQGEYIPTISKSYVSEGGYYHYSDDFYDFIACHQGKEVFPLLRMKEAPHYASLERKDPDYKRNIECFASKISGDIDSLAQYIIVLLNCNVITEKCNLLCDVQGDIIDGTAYVNTGMLIENIPDFRKIRYVDSRLLARLKDMLDLRDKEADRDLVRNFLKNITDVSSTDVSVVTRHLLPKKADSVLTETQKQELICCLFRLYMQRQGKMPDIKDDDETNNRIVPYLMTQSGEWEPASNLVFVDHRFPNGFERLHMEYKYDPAQSVAYPDFLVGIDNATPDDIQQFYCELGVNLYFLRETKQYGDDREYIKMLNLPSEVEYNCGSNRVGKVNYTRVAKPEFFDNLPLTDVLNVISKSGYIEDVCGKQDIKWFKNTFKRPHQVSLSYAAFLLRKVETIKNLSYYVLDREMWLPGYLPNPKPELSHVDRQLLLSLGAKKSLSDFSVKELYGAINNLAANSRENISNSGIQTHYHSLKQALDTHAELSLPVDMSLQMLCCINGIYEFRNSREIYYSDNNILPENVIKQLPMLVMRRREGEQKVKRLFGCHTLKEINVTVESKQDNLQVTKELNALIEKRKPYILAFASRGVGQRGAVSDCLFNEDVKNHLVSWSIKVVDTLNYCFVVPDNMKLNEQVLSMEAGELLCEKDHFYICSHDALLKDAMSEPRFINAVVEALCIELNLSSREIEDQFYRILTHNERELKFYCNRELEAELLQECERQFGFSHADVIFWRQVFKCKGLTFDESELNEKKITYLQENLNLSIHPFTAETFCTLHLHNLKDCRNKYKNDYFSHIYNELKQDTSRHKEYIMMQSAFIADDNWLVDILEQNDNKYQVVLDYDRLLRECMLQKFNYVPSDDYTSSSAPKKNISYLHDFDEFYLSDEDKSLLYFDGYKEYFDQLCNSKLLDDSDKSISQSHNAVLPIKECEIVVGRTDGKQPPISKHTHVKGNKQHRISERRRVELGHYAEDMVYDALTKSGEYEIGEIYSSYLSYRNNTNGDDSRGYDLEYRKLGDKLYRCLEIKYFNGNSIILSGNEYEVAQQNKARYDLALVTDSDIKIIRQAFDDAQFICKVNDYTIYLKAETKAETDLSE